MRKEGMQCRKKERCAHLTFGRGPMLQSGMARPPVALACLMSAPVHTRCIAASFLSPARMAMLTARASTSAAASTSVPLEYVTIAQPCRTEVEVKKSRFIVTAWPITSGKQAMQLIKSASDPSASHNCYAYRLDNEARSNDDGEPGGTAGRPILSAIEGEELQGVAVLVTRHFGGVKLGAGGLVRAYGNAARTCLRAAPRVTVKARIRVRVRAGFEALGTLYNLFDKYACERLSEDYEEGDMGSGGVDDGGGGGVVLVVSVDAGELESLMDAISDATSGQVIPQVLGNDEEGEQDEQ